ncbi:MAG TPA: hypothetical protein VGM39_05745, partial [Kofleriaceae bacterium]
MSDDAKDEKPASSAPPVNPALSEIPLVPVAPERPPVRRLFVGVRLSVATSNALARAAEQLARRAKDAGADL